MKLYNYHTHTERCLHATGEDEAFVKAAIEAGFCEIGFSDHSPWPFENGYVSYMRMTPVQLPDYVSSVKSLQEKYRDQITIRLGLECEYFKRYIPWLKNMLHEYGFDYIILGHHYSPDEQTGVYNGMITTPEELENYKNDVVEAIESGLFSYVAHPDLFMRMYPSFDSDCERVSREIIQKAVECSVPIEYNLLGFAHGIEDGRQGYPYPDFWRIAGEMGATAVIGIDAHKPEAYFDKALRDKAIETLLSYGLKLTDSIELNKFR